jgi:biopolymer transport protein ExbD
MPRRRNTSLPEEDFPMTPMIDMVFLLLVFFMTVSTLAQSDQRVKLDLPESETSKVPDDLSDRGTISLDAQGQIFIGSQPRTLDQMQASIKESLASNPDLRIHVRVDQTTAYEAIKKVLRACAEAGAYEVIYATYQQK